MVKKKNINKTVVLSRPRYEDCMDIINTLLLKASPKWKLQSIQWLDYDDVSQIIRLHIYKKWHLYDYTKPLEPWVSAIIHNQITNLIHSLYHASAPPCRECAADEGDDSCALYGKKCLECPLFAAWTRYRKSSHDLKMCFSLENHVDEVEQQEDTQSDMDIKLQKFHLFMLEKLPLKFKKVYQYIYIEHCSDEEAAQKLGYDLPKKLNVALKDIANYKKIITNYGKELIKDFNEYD